MRDKIAICKGIFISRAALALGIGRSGGVEEWRMEGSNSENHNSADSINSLNFASESTAGSEIAPSVKVFSSSRVALALGIGRVKEWKNGRMEEYKMSRMSLRANSPIH